MDCLRKYEEIRRIGERIREDALIARERSRPAETTLAIYNPASFPRSDVVEISGEWLTDGTIVTTMDGTALPAQRKEAGLLVQCPDAPPYGVPALRICSGELPATKNHI